METNMFILIQYGDTPLCLDRGNSRHFGVLARFQGYGLTPNGTSGYLKNMPAIIISNRESRDIMRQSKIYREVQAQVRGQLCNALPAGLNDGHLCTHGIPDNDGTFQEPCKGDSGGPLFVKNADRKWTILGVISGTD